MTVYRLTHSRYAGLSGRGSSLIPGRWNTFGEEAIYTSLECAGTIVELLAHTTKSLIPRDMALMNIRIHGEWVLEGGVLRDVTKGGRFVVCATSDHASAYLNSYIPQAGKAFALAVPSVLAPIWNVVLYANEGLVSTSSL